MAKIVVVLAYAGASVVWGMLPSLKGTPNLQRMSIQELHALAHVDALPVQQFEHMSVIHTSAENK